MEGRRYAVTSGKVETAKSDSHKFSVTALERCTSNFGQNRLQEGNCSSIPVAKMNLAKFKTLPKALRSTDPCIDCFNKKEKIEKPSNLSSRFATSFTSHKHSTHYSLIIDGVNLFKLLLGLVW